MKTLVVSIKSPSEALESFKKAYKNAKKKTVKNTHYEISFDNKKSFEKFAKNIHILSSILIFKPKSVYELSKITGKDVSNLNKLIQFFESIGAIELQKKTINGREVNVPKVSYDEIKFDLKAA